MLSEKVCKDQSAHSSFLKGYLISTSELTHFYNVILK